MDVGVVVNTIGLDGRRARIFCFPDEVLRAWRSGDSLTFKSSSNEHGREHPSKHRYSSRAPGVPIRPFLYLDVVLLRLCHIWALQVPYYLVSTSFKFQVWKFTWKPFKFLQNHFIDMEGEGTLVAMQLLHRMTISEKDGFLNRVNLTAAEAAFDTEAAESPTDSEQEALTDSEQEALTDSQQEALADSQQEALTDSQQEAFADSERSVAQPEALTDSQQEALADSQQEAVTVSQQALTDSQQEALTEVLTDSEVRASSAGKGLDAR